MKKCKIFYSTKGLSNLQKEILKEGIGKLSRTEIAQRLDVSLSYLNRYMTKHKIYSGPRRRYDKETIDQVVSFYLKHTRSETEKRFPDLNVRAIIETYLGNKGSHKNWTLNEILFTAKVGGLLTYERQGEIINRTYNSIKTRWLKDIGMSPKNLNGIPLKDVRDLIKKGCRYFYIKSKERFGRDPCVVLWCDLEKNLLDDVPPEIKQCVSAMSQFQKLIHGGSIEKLISEFHLRSCHVGNPKNK